MALTEEALVNVPGLMSRWVRLATGAKAHYVTSGESGPSVVLLHGGIEGSSGTAGWRFMAPFLAENGFRVYCPDLPAFGLTEGFEDVYEPGLAGPVDFIEDFANALCLDQFHIGGNSMGCQAAMNYTAAHPERVLSIAVIATAGNMQGLVDEEARMAADTRPPEKRVNIQGFDGSEQSMRTSMEAIVYRVGALDEDLLKMRTFAANKNRAAFARRSAAVRAQDENITARLSLKGRFDKLQIPAIYLCGLQDVTATPEMFYLQEDALPNVQVFYPNECGHQGQTDQPEMFNQVFLEFLRDGQVSRKTADWAEVSKRRPELASVVAAS